MTLAELAFLQEQLLEAGASGEVIVCLAAAAADWRRMKRLEAAERKAVRVAVGAEGARQLAGVPTASAGDGAGGADQTRTQSPDSIVANPDSGAASMGAATAAGGTPKAVARAALLMMPGLRPAARRVGARLIEHYNLATGRCDPSVVGIAAAEGLSERSTRRALAELQAMGLIQRVVHGAGRRNAFAIAWGALRSQAVAAENGARANPDSPRTRTLESGNPDTRVRLNLRRNTNRISGGGTRRPDPKQRELMLPLPGTTQTDRFADGTGRGDAVEAGIRGKYRGDFERMRSLLGIWWGISDGDRAGMGTLAAFEDWLRLHGPPKVFAQG